MDPGRAITDNRDNVHTDSAPAWHTDVAAPLWQIDSCGSKFNKEVQKSDQHQGVFAWMAAIGFVGASWVRKATSTLSNRLMKLSPKAKISTVSYGTDSIAKEGLVN